MAETIYPRNIISRKGWKKGIEAIDILNNCPNAIIGHWVKGTFDSCVDNSLGEGMERLSEEALPTKDLPNLSCSLLGALYMFEDFRFLPADEGKKPWVEDTDVPEEMITEKNFIILSNIIVVGWLISKVHLYRMKYPHGFSKKKEYDTLKEKAIEVARNRSINATYLKEWDDLVLAEGSQNQRVAELIGEARVNHDPTNLNFWHFTIDTYPAESDIKPIKNASDGWRFYMAANLADYLRRSFMYINESTTIPQITEKSIWEK